MSPIIPISSARVSDTLIHQRLMRQIQSDQQQLLQIQTQLSTGYRIELPSQDSPAALRIMGIQRLLERKEQVQVNLQTNQSYLGATDTALATVSSTLADIRATALGVVGTTATDTQRAAVIQEIDQAVLHLRDIGIQRFRGRYLFAGTKTTVRPFERTEEGHIRYLGNEGRLSSYSDIDLLFDTNLHGNEVFGVISDPVRGTADLDPILTYQTRLADLNGGAGIIKGSIEISDGTSTSVVDLSGAETIGDVAEMIAADPPGGRTLLVGVTATGLRIELAAPQPDDALMVREVSTGTTAAELGILTEAHVGSGPLVGRDLDPVLRKTTRLADILGVRASAVVRSPGEDNDLIFEADTPGDLYNGVTIQFADTATVGNESADFDPAAGTLTVHIEAGKTTAAHVVAALELGYDPVSQPFRARLDPIDETDDGQGMIDFTATATTTGGEGLAFDHESGLQIVNGGKTHTISLAGAETIEDLLNTLNGSGAGILAELNAARNGIDVRSAISGADFAIGENGGTTAAELGLRTFTRDTRLEDLKFGRGVHDWEGVNPSATATMISAGTDNDLVFRVRDGGPSGNGFTIRFQAAGAEAIGFDPVGRTLIFDVVPGVTTANRIVALLDGDAAARAAFEVELADGDGVPNSGDGFVDLGSAVTAGGADAGIDFTITRKDGVVLEVNINGLETIGDVLDRINSLPGNLPSDPGTPVIAQLAAYGNGIELVDNNAGPGRLSVSRTELSTAAYGLGLVPEGQETSEATPATFAGADVLSPGPNNDLEFQAVDAGTAANGIQVSFVDNGTGGPGNETVVYDPVARTLTFGVAPGFTTAKMLIPVFQADAAASAVLTIGLKEPENGLPNTGNGLVALTGAPVEVSGGAAEVFTGLDVAPREVEGLFTALLRLREALEVNDVWAVQRAMDMLDGKTLDMNFARAELGARQRGLGILQTRLEDEDVDLRITLSENYDADFAEVASNLANKQAAFTAALRATASISQFTLLDYL